MGNGERICICKQRATRDRDGDDRRVAAAQTIRDRVAESFCAEITGKRRVADGVVRDDRRAAVVRRGDIGEREHAANLREHHVIRHYRQYIIRAVDRRAKTVVARDAQAVIHHDVADDFIRRLRGAQPVEQAVRIVSEAAVGVDDDRHAKRRGVRGGNHADGIVRQNSIHVWVEVVDQHARRVRGERRFFVRRVSIWLRDGMIVHTRDRHGHDGVAGQTIFIHRGVGERVGGEFFVCQRVQVRRDGRIVNDVRAADGHARAQRAER